MIAAAKHAPTLLLPPHAAPLGMIVYDGPMFPVLKGQAVITFHGYRDQGHRLVALPIDAHGNPTGPLTDLIFKLGCRQGQASAGRAGRACSRWPTAAS